MVGYPSQYIAAQMITKDWVEPIDTPHQLFRASSDMTDAAGNVLVTAYPVERPDGQWAVMIVNKDYDYDHAVKVNFRNATNNSYRFFSGPVDQITFGAAQFQWYADQQTGPMGHVDPDGPPVRSTVNAAADTVFQLPKASITVVRGNITGDRR